ncbi:MAG: NUMOD4 domain-containing protein [Reichenbachiella sp.]
MEEWKNYHPEGAKYAYEVSNYGRVKSSATGVYLGNYKNAGYRCVPYVTTVKKRVTKAKPKPGFKSKMFYVHKTVALLFLDKDEDKPYLSFADMDRSNCHVDNLKYLNKADNYTYRMKTFVSPYDVHPNLVSNKGKLSDSDVRLIRRLINNSPTKLAKRFGCSYRTIWAIQTKRSYNRVK